jgi:hypothetical protein
VRSTLAGGEWKSVIGATTARGAGLSERPVSDPGRSNTISSGPRFVRSSRGISDSSACSNKRRGVQLSELQDQITFTTSSIKGCRVFSDSRVQV